jgi:hypothetical protein
MNDSKKGILAASVVGGPLFFDGCGVTALTGSNELVSDTFRFRLLIKERICT